MSSRPYGAAVALATLILLAATAAANGEDVKIEKLYFLGRGFAVDPANPLGLLEVKLAAAEVKLLGEGVGVGILELEGAKYKLSGVTVTDGTLNAALSGPASETGSIKCTRVSKKELDVGVCTLTISQKSYTAYILEAKRKFKPEEQRQIPDVKEYCSKNAEDKRCRDHYRDYCKDKPQAPECGQQDWPQECIDCRNKCESKCVQAPNQEECFFSCDSTCKVCKEKMESRFREARQSGKVVIVDKADVAGEELGECARCQRGAQGQFEENYQGAKERCQQLTGEEQAGCLKELEQGAQGQRQNVNERCGEVCKPIRPPGFEENACQRGQVKCKQACLERVGAPKDKETAQKFEACFRECSSSVAECPKIVTSGPQQDYCQECSSRCQQQKEDPRACTARYVTKCQSYCNEAAKQDPLKGKECNSQCEQRAREACQGNVCPDLSKERFEQFQRECSAKGGNFMMDKDARGCPFPRCERRQDACVEPYKCIPSNYKEEAYKRGCVPVNLQCPQPYAAQQPGTTAAGTPSQEFNQCFKCPEQQPQPTPACVCTQEYAPVCGTDSKTYGNKCMAGCANVPVAYVGECKAATPSSTPSPTASVTPTPSATPTATITATPTPTPTASPSPSPAQ